MFIVQLIPNKSSENKIKQKTKDVTNVIVLNICRFQTDDICKRKLYRIGSERAATLRIKSSLVSHSCSRTKPIPLSGEVAKITRTHERTYSVPTLK